MKTVSEIFRKHNFHLLNEILDKDFGIIYCNSITNPRDEIFNQPIKLKLCTKKKEQIEFLQP